MMAPDLNLIAEVILSAEGFANSRVLAKKSITLYNLMQQQLSKQSHYDYGLRSIKGVLTIAGTLKRTENNISEEQIIIRAVTARINLSSTIESQQLQFIMTELLEKRSKDKLGPASGAEKLLIFIDDLNLPRQTSNESPYQPPLELLRHFIGYGGWYDRKKCSWQSVMNTQVVCAMTPPSAGRAAIPSRL
jgi:hypothetical protein